MLSALFYFLLALLLLVVIHEYGHFQVARWCGVKVLRFSFGFGKILASWHDKKGTEYVWSLFPLGGYVKMLDETEGEVREEEKHLAFNRQPMWKKIAIVVAGPLFNFLFAFLMLWLVAIIGIKSLAPMIEAVTPGSIAEKAGLSAQQEIIALNDVPIRSWRDFQYAIMPYVGSEDNLRLTVKSLKNGEKTSLILPLADWHLDSKKPDLLASFGLIPFIPSIPPVIGEVLKDTPAANTPLKINDEIVAVDGKPIEDWLELVRYVKEHPNETIQLKVKRDGRLSSFALTIGSKKINGNQQGFLGLKSKKVDWPENWLRIQRESVLDAIPVAMNQTAHLTGATLTLIGRLVMGDISLNNISGPVGIAKGAGDSARSGIVYYFSFLALVSISLGVLNLLPVPMLDGGHLLFYAIEAIRRKPLTDEFKAAGIYTGLILLVALMLVALVNDISRLTY